MDYGLTLPSLPAGASAEGIEAGAEAAEAAGWTTLWTTDHVLVPHESAGDYGHIFDPITTLAYVGGRQSRIRLGLSVVVVPMRNMVILAKELATIDALTRGRLVVGVGVGWSETEYRNLLAGDLFHRRGAYLDESIAVWRHLWSGSTEPFHGRFVTLDDFVFGPLPAQGEALPILVGGRTEAAYRRAGRLGDGYHGTMITPEQLAERIPRIREHANAAGRPMPALSTRVNVRFAGATAPTPAVALTGDPESMAAKVRAFADLGVTDLALAFGETDPERVAAAVGRWHREVEPLA